jgi:hypothetical protein
MKFHRNSFLRPAHVLLVVAASLACATARADDRPGVSDPQLRYQSERATCMNGQSNQDQATCLREAGAALGEARRNALANGAAPSSGNALQRCDALAGSDRDACIARMEGQGSTSGSAATGGILRELESPVATPAAAK